MASKMAIWMVDKRERTNTYVVLCIRIARVCCKFDFHCYSEVLLPIADKGKREF